MLAVDAHERQISLGLTRRRELQNNRKLDLIINYARQYYEKQIVKCRGRILKTF